MIAALGYQGGSYVGRTRLGYATGSPGYGLGSISPGEYAFAIGAGFSQGDLDTLDAMGATDAEIDALMQGEIDVPGLMAKLSGTQPTQPITGATMQFEPTDWAAYGVEAALSSLDDDLFILESQIAAYPSIESAIGDQVRTERTQYDSWHAQYQGWVNQTSAPEVIHYPDGSVWIGQTSQSGVNPIIIVAVAAVTALAAAIVYYHKTTVAGTMATMEATSAQAQTGTAAINQSAPLTQQAAALDVQANAVAHSDPAKAAQLHQQAASLRAEASQILTTAGQTAGSGGVVPKATDWSAWFQNNAIWVIGAAVAIFVGPSLIKKI
jgi:hypothetical protein